MGLIFYLLTFNIVFNYCCSSVIFFFIITLYLFLLPPTVVVKHEVRLILAVVLPDDLDGDAVGDGRVDVGLAAPVPAHVVLVSRATLRHHGVQRTKVCRCRVRPTRSNYDLFNEHNETVCNS